MVLDEQVKKYRHGGCFAMAEALHRLTGWCIDFGACTHAFVVTPANEVMDIDGRVPWDAFLAFLVTEGCLPESTVSEGRVQMEDVPNPPPILWRHWGCKAPSETAIKQAMTVARRPPNLAAELKNSKDVSLEI